MSREWQPGDVAIRRGADGRESLAICVDDCRQHGTGCWPPGVAAGLHWHTYRDGRPDWDTLAHGAVTYRPLVVIDTEDTGAVTRLADTFSAAEDPRVAAASSNRINALQIALREFADPKPRKPDEPTGLGAVVEDTQGVRWVHVGRGYWDADPTSAGVNRWQEFTAVRVLSEGVTS